MFKPKPQSNALAAVLIVIAAAFIAATMLLAKSLGAGARRDPLQPLQISHGRVRWAALRLAMREARLKKPAPRIHTSV